MTNKHTDGPWEAVSNLVRTVRNEDGTGGFLVAECPANIGSRIEDARLIAAAPDLLAVLLLVAGEVTDGVRPTSADSYLPSDIVAAVQSAIAKAIGGQS
jgi:hypothetical protein